ncbi:MAG: prolipoprotein diacylglyceryl transferase, partial [Calditrichaeota bacterium]|nr:prolipoprotein diacylglyceryl transferase [Calditrichota bacterium]
AYLAIFFILYRTYQAKKARTEPGLLLGMFLFMVFGFRFFVEFFKEVQTPWENALPLTMGQFLSIPFVLIGLYLYYRAKQAPPVEVAPPPKPAPRKQKKR